MTLVDIVNNVNQRLQGMAGELGGRYELYMDINLEGSHQFETYANRGKTKVQFTGRLGRHTADGRLEVISDKEILEKVCQIAREIGEPTLEASFYEGFSNIPDFTLEHEISPDQLKEEVRDIKKFYEGHNWDVTVCSRYHPT